jgi:Family of unknown function (DUF6516)
MSRSTLQAYFDEIEQRLLGYSNLYVEQFSAIVLTPERANLRLRLRFNLTYLLAVSEALLVVDNQIAHLDYRYHFQDDQNNLIFRYDSTPHFPDLPSFPHHRHLPDTVIASEKPTLIQVL